jgi:hypothetical protein
MAQVAIAEQNATNYYFLKCNGFVWRSYSVIRYGRSSLPNRHEKTVAVVMLNLDVRQIYEVESVSR